MSRNNQSIWRLARWLHLNIGASRTQDGPWEDVGLHRRHSLYDKAADLLKKIALNEFTGQDNHGD